MLRTEGGLVLSVNADGTRAARSYLAFLSSKDGEAARRALEQAAKFSYEAFLAASGRGAPPAAPESSGSSHAPTPETDQKTKPDFKRINRAKQAGLAARAKLASADPHARVPPTPWLEGLPSSRCAYAVLRVRKDAPGPAGLYRKWSQVQPLVCQPNSRELEPEVVFHAFPTIEEIAAYYEGAGLAVPELQ